MSYFLFGTFNVSQNEKNIQEMKLCGKEKDIYIWFDEEIAFYEDIQRMLIEQKSQGIMKFAITSKKQPYNSSDVLFPFDKFTNEDLFADKSREYFKKYCRNNISILFNYLNQLIESFQISQMEIFVVEGYDDDFFKKECDLDGVKEHLILQIEDRVSIDSCIYYVI